MRPWHDTYIDDATVATAFPVIVDDRALHSAVYTQLREPWKPCGLFDREEGGPTIQLPAAENPLHPPILRRRQVCSVPAR